MKYNYLIERYLKETGETAQDFARRAGVSRATLYRVLSGVSVKLPLLERILRAAGFSLAVTVASESSRSGEEE